MVEAVEKAGVPNMVWYNYRRVPAVTLAKQLIDEGRLGRIFHYRAKFLQDWTISDDLPQGGAALWRLDVDVAGSGVTGDLLAHCIDTALWLNGDIDSVSAMTETFVKERKHNLTGKVGRSASTTPARSWPASRTARWRTFESTRYARGHKALYTFEINGENASIMWDLHDLHRLQYFDHRDEGRVRGWRSIHVTDGDHPYMEHWWVPGLQIGYEHTFVHQVGRFPDGLATGKPVSPDLPRGAGHRLRHRRGAEIGEVGEVGDSETRVGEVAALRDVGFPCPPHTVTPSPGSASLWNSMFIAVKTLS